MPHMPVQRVLVGLYLCGLSVTCFALPLPESAVSQELAKQMHLAGLMLRMGDRVQSAPYHYNHALLPPSRSRPRSKRFGIAGLDNVDVITSILDQQRARKKPRRPTMSVSLSMEDIRRLIEAGR